MKINAEVLSAATTGDAIKIHLQGSTEGQADWRPLLSLIIEIPDTAANRRAYYVGRRVCMRVTTT